MYSKYQLPLFMPSILSHLNLSEGFADELPTIRFAKTDLSNETQNLEIINGDLFLRG